MVRRAVNCFHSQTYENKQLLILGDGFEKYKDQGVDVWPLSGFEKPRSIGALRNLANGLSEGDILAHFDSDDWSHPNRVAEQVSLLTSSRPKCGCSQALNVTGRCPHGNELGAECVGYSEMLFWDERHYVARVRPRGFDESCEGYVNEAWIYRSTMQNYALGTSMCYWSDTWRRGNAFPDRSEGCDDLYWSTGNRVKITSVSAFQEDAGIFHHPKMIASIHGGNTCAKLDPGKKEWTRVPVCDVYCRERMQL